MKKELKEINVGEVLSEIKSATEGDVLLKFQGTKREKAKYEILFSDLNDFGIKKTSKRVSKVFISIFSKNLLFFKDEITGEITKIVSSDQITNFFNDLKANEVIIPKGSVQYAEQDITKSEIPNLYKVLTACQSIKKLLMANIISFEDLENFQSRYNSFDNIEATCEKNKNLLKYIITTREHDYKGNFYELLNIIKLAYQIYDISDLDSAKYFVDKQKISTKELLTYDGFSNFKKYNLNMRRFIDYILFDLYKQGCANNILRTYNDYLNMSQEYYGYVKEKYPKTLMTDHNILSLKLIEKRKISQNSNEFEKIMNDCENFAYQTLTDRFIISMPKVSMDLVDEGQQLNHCVASYVDKVVNGDCIVVFMREKENPDDSYLTIEILPDRSVSQIEGLNKRRDLTNEEQDFIIKWSKARHLKITAENITRK